MNNEMMVWYTPSTMVRMNDEMMVRYKPSTMVRMNDEMMVRYTLMGIDSQSCGSPLSSKQ